MIVAGAVLPAASLTVTVAVAVRLGLVRRAADHAGAGIEGQPRRQARSAVLRDVNAAAGTHGRDRLAHLWPCSLRDAGAL